MKVAVLLFCLCFAFPSLIFAQEAWQAGLDSNIRFYQTTDFGVVLAGTEKSLYAVDGKTGSILWRRKTGRSDQSGVTPVPNTDLVLVSRDVGDRSRIEAVDLMTGSSIWTSDKVKGDVMQLALDPERDELAVVLVKDARGKNGDGLKKKPVVHMLRLTTGDEIWKRDADADIELMQARYGDDLGEINFTLDNYRAPLLLDGRLYLFYDGVASYDASTGDEVEREKFKINEDGLALTEADPIVDDRYIYLSGRGRVRAVDRKTGQVAWRADDLGTTPEMALVGSTLYVRTGGQFTRIKDGETVSKGPYGISAINTSTGDILWRFKGADKGITNYAFRDASTLILADRDDLIDIDARTGKRISKVPHGVDNAQFIVLNEKGNAVVGGPDEIASFDGQSREVWRVRHKPPSRGVLRIVAGIALRATALYFRYGGLASSALTMARGGLNLAATVNSFRWSGLKSQFGSFDLTTLASNAATNYVGQQIYVYGALARMPNALARVNGLSIQRPSVDLAGRVTPSSDDVQESVFDRLDPSRAAERLSDYLLRRQRLGELRGNYMYYFTDLKKPFDTKGLVGVNINTGEDARYALVSDPNPMFTTDETIGLLYSVDGSRLQAFEMMAR